MQKHKTRGKIIYSYSLETISLATGLSMNSLYKRIAQKQFDPADLASVARFITSILLLSQNEIVLRDKPIGTHTNPL